MSGSAYIGAASAPAAVIMYSGGPSAGPWSCWLARDDPAVRLLALALVLVPMPGSTVGFCGSTRGASADEVDLRGQAQGQTSRGKHQAPLCQGSPDNRQRRDRVFQTCQSGPSGWCLLGRVVRTCLHAP